MHEVTLHVSGIMHMRCGSLLRGLPLTVLLLLAVFSAPPPRLAAADVKDDQKRIYIDEQLRLADGLMKRGHFELAADEYRRLIKMFPDSELVADAWTQLGEALASSGKKDEALATYRQFFEKFPAVRTFDSARVAYARILARTGREGDFGEAVKILAGIAGSGRTELVKEAAAYALGRAYAENGRADLAAKEFAKLAEKEVSGDQHIYRAYGALELANLLRKEKRSDAARIAAAVADNTKAPREAAVFAHLMLADMLKEDRKFNEAVMAYEQLNVLYPGTPEGAEALVRRVECFFLNGDYRKAADEADKTLARPECPPENRAGLLYYKACSLGQQGFHDRAADTFLAILAETSPDSEVFARSADGYLRSLAAAGKSAEAEKKALELAGDRKNTAAVRKGLVLAFASVLGTADAKAAFLEKASKSLDFPADKAEILLRLAEVLYGAGSYEKAAGFFAEAASAAGAPPQAKAAALAGLASCRGKTGRTDEALKAYGSIIEQFPSSEQCPDALLQSSIILLNKKDGAAAENLLRKLAADFKDSPLRPYAIFYLGYIKFASGSRGDAEKLFLEVLKTEGVDPALESDTRLYLAWSFILGGRSGPAKPLIANALKRKEALDSAPPEMLSCLTDFLLKEKSAELARLCAAKLSASEDPKWRQEGLYAAGMAEKAAGNPQQAAVLLKKALDGNSDPDLACRTATALGEALAASGRKDEAVAYFERNIENPVNKTAAARARLGLARILSEKTESTDTAGRYAMSVFILTDDPDTASEAMILAISLSLKAGKKDEARKTFEEFSRKFPHMLEDDDVKRLKEQIEGGAR